MFYFFMPKNLKYKRTRYSDKNAVENLYPIFEKVKNEQRITSLDIYRRAMQSMENPEITRSIEKKVQPK